MRNCVFCEKKLWHFKNSPLVMQLYIIAINSILFKMPIRAHPCTFTSNSKFPKLKGKNISKEITRKFFKKENPTLSFKNPFTM